MDFEKLEKITGKEILKLYEIDNYDEYYNNNEYLSFCFCAHSEGGTWFGDGIAGDCSLGLTDASKCASLCSSINYPFGTFSWGGMFYPECFCVPKGSHRTWTDCY